MGSESRTAILEKKSVSNCNVSNTAGEGLAYITTFGAEEVTSMPFGSASHDHFALDGRLAALASWAEEFVEVQMAVESDDMCLLVIFGSFCEPLISLCLGFLVKSNAFERSLAVMTHKAFRMKP